MHGRSGWEADGIHAAFPVDQFEFEEACEKLDVVEALGGTLPGEGLVFPEKGRKLQQLELMSPEDLRGLAHDWPSVIRLM